MASAPTSSAARSQAWIWTVRFTTESEHIGPGTAPLGRSSGCPPIRWAEAHHFQIRGPSNGPRSASGGLTYRHFQTEGLLGRSGEPTL
jgi:hypothetical protein